MLRRGIHKYIFCLLAFTLAACHHRQAVVVLEPLKTTGTVKQQRQLSRFNRVDVQGQMNVRLRTGFSRSAIILSGSADDLAQVQFSVNAETLFIHLGKGYPHHGGVSVEIRTNTLNAFRYEGAGIVRGTQIRSNMMDVLSINNSGSTVLSGHINLRHLIVKGNGSLKLSGVRSQGLQVFVKNSPQVQLSGNVHLSRLVTKEGASVSMSWVDSDVLRIKATGSSIIRLAGKANKVDITLCDFAQFKGRGLRGGRIFTKTFQHSVAEINSRDRQHSLASDSSNIYFYNLPVMKTDFMALDGSVLDMRDWGLYRLQEYTLYNKQLQ